MTVSSPTDLAAGRMDQLMFRKMRRFKQQVSEEECIRVLKEQPPDVGCSEFFCSVFLRHSNRHIRTLANKTSLVLFNFNLLCELSNPCLLFVCQTGKCVSRIIKVLLFLCQCLLKAFQRENRTNSLSLCRIDLGIVYLRFNSSLLFFVTTTIATTTTSTFTIPASWTSFAVSLTNS